MEVQGGPSPYLELPPGGEGTLTVRLASGADGARVFLRMADPCAQGKANCPGWDTTRYPGVEHTREAFTLSASSPEATFRFSVAQDALPQGPFKWEVVAQDSSGKEWTTPVYLRILREGDEGFLQAVNRWRSLVGVRLAQGEDLERGFECWQYGRYGVKNWNNPDYPHTTDPSKPFWTPGADRCAQTNHLPAMIHCLYSERPLPPNFPARALDILVSVPIHRFAWLAQTDAPRPGGGVSTWRPSPGGNSQEACATGEFSGEICPAPGCPRRSSFPSPAPPSPLAPSGVSGPTPGKPATPPRLPLPLTGAEGVPGPIPAVWPSR